MRNVIFSVLFFGFVQSLSATDGNGENPAKWKIGIIAAGHYSTGLYGFHPALLPGVQVNRIIGKYELRAGFEHVTTTFNAPSPLLMYYGEGFENRRTLRVGLQRNISLSSRWSFYTSADLGYRHVYSEFDVAGCFGPLGISQKRMNGGGMITSLGIEFQASKRISLFAEYRAEAFLYGVHEDFYYNSADIKPTRNKYSMYDFSFGSIGHVGLSISI
jgi:hypothetical protein